MKLHLIEYYHLSDAEEKSHQNEVMFATRHLENG